MCVIILVLTISNDSLLAVFAPNQFFTKNALKEFANWECIVMYNCNIPFDETYSNAFL